MTAFDYRLVDWDNHYYEPTDAFTRFGDAEVKKFVRWVSEGKRQHIVFGNAVAANIPNPTFNPIGKPGAYHQRLRELAAKGEHRNTQTQERYGELEPLPDHYVQRAARLETMKDQGIERAVFFPTLGVGVDGLNADKVAMTFKLFHAFNQWLDEDWGFNYRDTIYSAPFIPNLDPVLATAELDYALERGAKVITMRPGPADGRSPADPVWDPFWARINEARVVVAYHAAPGPDEYDAQFVRSWQRHGEGDRSYENNLKSAINSLRGMHETCLALVLGNLFGRFPNVRVASVELGSAWVPYCLYQLDHAGGLLGRHVEAFGQLVTERPSDIFKRHIWVSPYPEDDIASIVDAIGAQRVLLGSDWPHLEGTPEPIDYAHQLHGLDDATVRRIMRDNGLELLVS
ncbi:MAG: amidohydrolase family protein [Acidimicrobiia bacterium]